MIGQTIQHYKILEKLGEGGMGVVYKARDTKLDRDVALKFLPQHLTSSEEDKQRFTREAKAAALNHPNICTIYYVEEHEDNQFIVMEYVDGNTLRELQKSGNLTPEDAIEYAAQIADALNKAHDAGIVHRDIKPGNLMVNADGHIRVLDFGLAKLKGSAEEITKTGSTVGTIAYMSPEQIQGQQVDHRADNFAFGVVFFEMLTGVMPFRGEHEAALTYSIVNEEPASIQTYLPDAPETLEHFFVRALAKDPGERFSSAGEVIEALGDLKETKGITIARAQAVKDTTASYAAPEQEKQQDSGSSTTISITLPGVDLGEIALGGRGLVIGAAGIVLVAVFVGWWFMGNATEEEVAVDEDRVAVFPFDVRGSEELAHWDEGMVDLLSQSIDGAGPLLSVDPNAVMSRMRQDDPQTAIGPDEGSVIARDFEAGRFVLGSVMDMGDEIRLRATWYGPGGTELGNADITAEDAAEINSAVDELARRAIADLVGDVAAERVDLAAQTSSSTEALTAYLEGQRAYRSMDWQNALDHYQRAIEEDPDFALAHYGTARSAAWIGDPSGSEALQRALELSEVLPDRDRKMIEAMHLFVIENNPDEAEDQYREVLQSHPDDVEAWTWLGDVQFHYNGGRGLPVTKARESLERADELDPTHQEPLMHLVQLALVEQDDVRLDSLTADLERRSLDSDQEVLYRVIRSYVLSDGPDAELKQQLQNVPPILLLYTTWILLSGHHVHEAKEVIRTKTLPDRPRATRVSGHTWIAEMHAARGELEAANEELLVIAELDSAAYLTTRTHIATLPFLQEQMTDEERSDLIDQIQRWDADAVTEREGFRYIMAAEAKPLARDYLLGLLRAAEGNTAEVRDHSARLDEADPLPFARFVGPNTAGAVRAEVERWKGSHETALDQLESLELLVHRPSYRLLESARERFLKAELMAEVGRSEEALSWYKTIDGVGFGDLLYMAPAHYGRAQVLEELDRTEEAAEAYEQFLELWADADPVFEPKVEQARERLEALSEEHDITAEKLRSSLLPIQMSQHESR